MAAGLSVVGVLGGRPGPRRRRLLTGGALILAVTACADPVIDGQVTTLVVRGVVEDDLRVPTLGAIVHVAWQPWTCGDLGDFPPDTTTADGRFEISAWGWGTFTAACVRVRAEPPVDRPLQTATVQFDEVTLHPEDGPDTLEVHLTLGTSVGLALRSRRGP